MSLYVTNLIFQIDQNSHSSEITQSESPGGTNYARYFQIIVLRKKT